MKKLIGLLAILAVIFTFSGMVLAEGAGDIELRELENKITVKPPSDMSLDYCALAKTNGSTGSIYAYLPGFQTVTYINPASCPGVPTYPFEITTFHFTLYDTYSSSPWPYPIDVVVYDMLQEGDPCQGPGAERCRFTVVCDQASFEWPNVGAATFPQVCCVDGPFFIGLYLTDPNPSPPSPVFDNQAPPCCDNWFFNLAYWQDWCMTFGDPPTAGYPLFWIDGETPPNNCDGEEPVYDLWKTPEGHNTNVYFGCPPIPIIPAGFFGPGSDPFDGRIDFRGDPLETSPPDVLGPTDTIVKRSRPAELPGCPDSDGPIETQIVALDLVSTAPITVTYFGGDNPEDWDVRVCLSESVPQPFGYTIFDRVCQEGGTFAAYIPVIPMFIFTRISDGMEVHYDFGDEGQTINYEVYDAHWQFGDSFFDVYMATGDELVSNCDDEPDISIGPSAVDLIPGLQAIPCENCVDPPTEYLIPITSLIEGCAQQDVWPPHDVDEDIPTLTEWGMIILVLLLLTAGTVAVIRRRKAAVARSN